MREASTLLHGANNRNASFFNSPFNTKSIIIITLILQDTLNQIFRLFQYIINRRKCG